MLDWLGVHTSRQGIHECGVYIVCMYISVVNISCDQLGLGRMQCSFACHKLLGQTQRENMAQTGIVIHNNHITGVNLQSHPFFSPLAFSAFSKVGRNVEDSIGLVQSFPSILALMILDFSQEILPCSAVWLQATDVLCYAFIYHPFLSKQIRSEERESIA